MKKSLEIAGAGLVAAVVIACGEAAMNGGAGMMGGAGGMLADAGEVMMDAGAEMMRDAGAMMMDAGGGMMRDAGEVVRDAGEMMRDASTAMRDASDGMMDSAMAQSCEACSPSGRQQVVTADQDIEQLRGGTIERDGWTEERSAAYTEVSGPCNEDYQSRVFFAEVAEGPVVLTDFGAFGGMQLSVYAVPEGSSCFDASVETFTVQCTNNFVSMSGPRYRKPSGARTLLLSSTGMRVLVPAGEKVCALTNATSPVLATSEAVPTNGIVAWSGFVPYD
jgi:hypothetical protein